LPPAKTENQFNSTYELLMPIKTMFCNSKTSEVKATKILINLKIFVLLFKLISLSYLIYEVKIYVVFFEGLYYIT